MVIGNMLFQSLRMYYIITLSPHDSQQTSELQSPAGDGMKVDYMFYRP